MTLKQNQWTEAANWLCDVWRGYCRDKNYTEDQIRESRVEAVEVGYPIGTILKLYYPFDSIADVVVIGKCELFVDDSVRKCSDKMRKCLSPTIQGAIEAHFRWRVSCDENFLADERNELVENLRGLDKDRRINSLAIKVVDQLLGSNRNGEADEEVLSFGSSDAGGSRGHCSSPTSDH